MRFSSAALSLSLRLCVESRGSRYRNNVENVFIREPFTSNLVVTVQARRVNVPAITDYFAATQNTNDIVQDFALVISSGDLTLTNAISLSLLQTNAARRDAVSGGRY